MSADATSPLPSPPSGPDVRTTGLWGATTYPEAAWLSIGFTNYYWPDGDDDPTTVVEVPVTREACFRIAMQFLQMAQHAEWPDDDPGIYAPRRPAIDADRLGARVARLQSLADDLRSGDLDGPLRGATTRQLYADAIAEAVAALAALIPGVDHHPDRALYAPDPEEPSAP